jgi:hypothetical protein
LALLPRLLTDESSKLKIRLVPDFHLFRGIFLESRQNDSQNLQQQIYDFDETGGLDKFPQINGNRVSVLFSLFIIPYGVDSRLNLIGISSPVRIYNSIARCAILIYVILCFEFKSI